MTNPLPSSLTEALLEALEHDDDYEGRARGSDIGRRSYLLREIPVPVVAPLSVVSERRGGHSVARSQAEPAPAQDLELAAANVVAATVCGNCGARNVPGSKFCHTCGNPIGESSGSFATVERRPAPMPVSLVAINEDGGDGKRFPLSWDDNIIGRTGDVAFPTDAFLSPRHARLTIENGRFHVEDLYSLNGTFLKLRDEVPLSPGDTFLMGRQVLRFEKFDHQIQPKARSADGTRYMGSPPPTGAFRLLQVGIGGVIQNAFCVPDTGCVIGREKGDFVFTRDKFMSSRHAQIFLRDDQYWLADMNSSNGTWVKIWERRAANHGDFIFLGQQLFRVEFAV